MLRIAGMAAEEFFNCPENLRAIAPISRQSELTPSLMR